MFQLGNEITVSTGNISKMHTQRFQYEDLIQMNAAITHGNSGGPLVNSKGEVIGINTLGFYSAQGEREPGINFAISMSSAKPVIKDLEQAKNRNYIGLNLYPNTFKDYYGTDQGMAVIGIASGSPASQIGMEPADLLLKLEGTSITSDEEVCNILRSHADGDQLKVNVYRVSTGQLLEGEITVGKTGAAGSGTAMRVTGTLAAPETPTAVVAQGSVPPTTEAQTTAEAQSTPEVSIVVANDFDDGSAGSWNVSEDKDASQKVVNGAYTVNITGKVYVTEYPDEANNIVDGVISADVTPKGVGDAGLIARYSKTGSNGDFYTCWISNDKQFGCDKRVNGAWTEMIQPKKSTEIKPEELNTLSLVVSGEQFSFEINDKQVATFSDSSLKSGGWGVFVDPTNVDKPAFTAAYDQIIIGKVK